MDEYVVDVECNSGKNSNCAVTLLSVSCDGYKEEKKIGVFSHFHEDHIRAMNQCISSYDVLLTHNITFSAIVALEPGMQYRTQWAPQQFGTDYYGRNVTICLLKANHIPGSAQVYVESNDRSMLYSGDFSFPDMQIKKADYLVLDASHGDPWHDGRTDRKSVMNRLFDEVKEKTDMCKSVVIRVSGGTLQEIVWNFEVAHSDKILNDVTFVMSEKQKKILFGIYEPYCREFRNNIVCEDSHDFWNLVRNRRPFVLFTTRTVPDDDLKKNYYNVVVDKYKFGKENAPIIPFKNGAGCRYNLAAHSSIEDIYSYIQAVNPRYVVTDYSRSTYALQLAKLIEQRFPKIRATYRPPYRIT